MHRTLAAVLAGMAITSGSGSGMAHHSEAPHFLLNRSIEFQGVVQKWSAINPHAVLEIRDARDGSSWHCETQGVATLLKMGISAGSFSRGNRVVVSAAPGRRDAKACLLRTVTVDGGATVSFLPQARPAPPTPVPANTSIFGSWISMAPPPAPGAGAPGSAPAIAMRAPVLDSLTEAGRQAMLAYDPIKDDPVYRCSPVSPLRLWRAPASPFSLRRDGDRIVLRHEFMDAERIIHLDQASHPRGTPRSLLGHSIGRFEGDTLIVDTAGFSPGVLQQYVLDAAGELRGLLRSEHYHLQERIRLDAAAGQLEVQYQHNDPKYYTAPLPPGTVRYGTSPQAEFGKYGCRRTTAQAAPR